MDQTYGDNYEPVQAPQDPPAVPTAIDGAQFADAGWPMSIAEEKYGFVRVEGVRLRDVGKGGARGAAERTYRDVISRQIGVIVFRSLLKSLLSFLIA